MRLNFIPREGGNSFSGMLISSFTNEGMAGDNFTQELRNRGLRTPNNVKERRDQCCLRWPDSRDRLWFFGTVLYNRTQNWVAGMLVNRNAFSPTSFAYDPDPDQPAFTDVLTRNGAGRVTWQVNGRTSSPSRTRTYTCQCSTATTAIVSAESGLPQRCWPNGGWNVDWTAPLTSRLLLEGVIYHRFINSWRTHPFGLPDVGDTIEDIVAYNVDAISKNLIGVQDQALGITHHATTASNMRNKSHDTPFRATLSYVTGAHSYKFGISNNIGRKQNMMNFDAPCWYALQQRRAEPDHDECHTVSAARAPRCRSWRLRPGPVDHQARHRFLWSAIRPLRQLVPGTADRTCGARAEPQFLPQTDGISWHDISPRVGIAYDLFGTGKTALKGSFGKCTWQPGASRQRRERHLWRRTESGAARRDERHAIVERRERQLPARLRPAEFWRQRRVRTAQQHRLRQPASG